MPTLTEKRTLAEVAKLPMQHRMLDMQVRRLERAEGDDPEAPALYELTASTETEVKRWWGVEILDHSKAAVDMLRMDNGAAVLIDHYSDQVGVVERAWLDGKSMKAEIRFSRSVRGREIEQDVVDKVRRNISIGYFVNAVKLEETREDGTDVYRVVRWQPAEISIVSVPADVNAGIGRSEAAGEYPVVFMTDGQPVTEDRMLNRSVHFNAAGAGGGAVATAAAPPAEVIADAPEKREAARADEIRGMGTANSLPPQVVSELIASTLSVAEVGARIAEARKTRGTATVQADPILDFPASDRARFSYHRAIKNGLAMKEGGKTVGLEAEVHDHLERSLPEGFKRHGGVLVPMTTRAALATGVTGKGAEIVQAGQGEMIEILRAKAIVLSLGARLFTGFTGPVEFPKVTAGGTISWMAENPGSDAADSDPTLGLALLTPKTMIGVVPFTRQLLNQASIDVEAFVKDELATYHSLALDKAAIHGKGANGEPTGIYKALEVNAKAFGSAIPDIVGLMDMIVAVADRNADLGTLKFLASVVLAGRLRVTQEFAGTNGSTLWQGNLRDGSILGYGASASTQASKTMTGSEETGGVEQALIFGNWADLLVALFGQMELVVDVVTRKKRAMIEVASYQQGDVMPRHGQSFTKATAALAA